MSKEKFEHKNELDCEVTVFEGAYTTCDEIKDESLKKRKALKDKSSTEEKAAENYDI